MKRSKLSTSLFLFFSILIFNISTIFPQPDKVLNSSELKLAIEKLNILGSVLYVAAHPDDENTALLAYFSKGKLLRTGYLSLTRGDGGQNLVGTEQGPMLGVLRTQELLAARRIDGAKQFFSRAIDFGYSKSGKETMQIWGRNKILSDVVWVIRKFKPDVIITRFPGTGEGGHGNHTASEILAAEAFKIAGDSTKFPEQLKYVRPWQPKRILWNAWLPILKKRGENLKKLLKVDIGVYNPLLGESYTEIAAKARSMHKSQGFGSSARYGESINYFEPIAGKPANKSLFDGVNLTWSRVAGGKKISMLLKKADKEFNPENPSVIIPLLLNVYAEMNKIKDNYWVHIKEKELLNVVRSCSGMLIQASASEHSVSPGKDLTISTSIVNRSKFPFTLKKVSLTYDTNPKVLNEELNYENLITINSTIKIPNHTKYSQPYWLRKPSEKGCYVVDNQQLIGNAVNAPALTADVVIAAGEQLLKFKVPVEYRWTDPVKGAEYRPIAIAPEVAINLENKVYVFPNSTPRKVGLILTANADNVSGKAKLILPEGWKSVPQDIPFDIKNRGDEKSISFTVTPPAKKSEGIIHAEVSIGNKIIRRGMVTINHSYFPIQTVFPDAKAKVIRLNISKVINNIGYIMGPGDKIPEALEELGYKVTMLNDNNLLNDNLSRFDAIITGIRLYNTNKNMTLVEPKLLNYVKEGGTLVVQYNKNFDLVTDKIGPYPFHISKKRVTVEEAPVKFLDSQSPLLNFPNKITEEDFDNWIQERGVYFPDKWDSHYKTVISCHDPGEKPLEGGLLYTHYGKGVYIYTGYDWFRELPAGVPGAFRIFVNLISAGVTGRQVN